MKTNSASSCVFSCILIAGFAFFSSSALNAWTISVLNSQNNSGGNGVLNRPFTDFENYMRNNGSDLVQSSLADYSLGDSDAVIVNLSNKYSETELSVLKALLHSNVNVLVFGEHNGWTTSNEQLAALVGGTYDSEGEHMNQSVISQAYPAITQGLTTVQFNAYSRIIPTGIYGHSLVSDDGMTLWGDYDNFLIVMDVDALSGSLFFPDEDEETQQYITEQNDLFMRNVANWLSGITPVPEPSSYAMLFGLSILATVASRRKRR